MYKTNTLKIIIYNNFEFHLTTQTNVTVMERLWLKLTINEGNKNEKVIGIPRVVRS